MIVYIAEKPSVARAVAAVFPQPQRQGQGFITLANGDVITWCIGHLLEQAEPEAYDVAYKQWRRSDLPIIPTQWQLQVKPQTRQQFATVQQLIKTADHLVNMGDPDRVGQLLVDEVINHAGISPQKRHRTLRCLINDMNPTAIKKALQQLRPNSDFVALATSALARARADWLYGINMTRLCTLLGRSAGYTGVLSIGRVQTPVLGLVVQRDREIDRFVSRPFYEVFITLQTSRGELFQAKWQPSEACHPYMDEEHRVLSKPLADKVIAKVIGKQGAIKAVSRQKKQQPAPLPYSLSSLQIDASKRFNLNAQKTLDICQQLYERHKLITYPRSDCRYLPKGHYAERQTVAQSIARTTATLSDSVRQADLDLKSKAWNDAKVGAHHAIIPTSRAVPDDRLSQDEQNIYELVARQYLMQFYPPFEYVEHQIDSEVAGGLFIAKQKSVISNGWKALLPPQKTPKQNAELSSVALPNVKSGDPVTCIDGKIDEKQTSPPKRFTDATLLSAMTGIARYVSDPAIKKVLRDTDGLGTEATRAGIIELLFKRRFLTKKGKEIHATDIGGKLIESLPAPLSVPDMTAHWESQLEAISDRRLKYAHFIHPLTAELHRLIAAMEQCDFAGLKGKGSGTRSGKPRRHRTAQRPTRSRSS